MPQDIFVCRFCLESNNTKRNPLIDPCECSGSIRFVHERCLSKWRRIDPRRNGELCLICLAPYNLKTLQSLELLPDNDKLVFFLLRFPIVPCFTVNYGMVFQLSLSKQKNISDVFEFYQYGFQILYFLLFFMEWKVRNKRLYWKHWQTVSSLSFLSFYLAANVLLHEGYFLAIFPINLLLALLWQRHTNILMEMNIH